MRSSLLGAALVLLSIGLAASAQSQNDDPVQALKDSLSQDQQNSILQGVIGKGNGTSKKTDSKLSTPETVQSKTSRERDILDEKGEKTRDGRILRQLNEDPELRADDSVLIDLTPLDDVCNRGAGSGSQNGNDGLGNGLNNGAGGTNPLSGLNALSGASGIPGVGAGAGMSGSNVNNGANGNNGNGYDLTRCPPRADPSKTEKEKTDEEKTEAARFRSRVLSSNPYKLNHFGVLELPGLPAIPMAGLTASEATKRLGADSDLSGYFVKLTLLRLLPSGQEALKPFGYDLFEGVPSTFAPV
jgi:hypothetical protein